MWALVMGLRAMHAKGVCCVSIWFLIGGVAESARSRRGVVAESARSRRREAKFLWDRMVESRLRLRSRGSSSKGVCCISKCFLLGGVAELARSRRGVGAGPSHRSLFSVKLVVAVVRRYPKCGGAGAVDACSS